MRRLIFVCTRYTCMIVIACTWEIISGAELKEYKGVRDVHVCFYCGFNKDHQLRVDPIYVDHHRPGAHFLGKSQSL